MSYKTRLDVIEEDLNKWRAGKKIYKYRRFLMPTALALLPCSIFLYGVFHIKAGFVVLGFMLAFLLLRLFTGKEDTPDTWEGRINQALLSYSPMNQDAFEKLCRTVNEKRAIEPDDVAAWLKDEKEARALFRRQRDERQRYSFTKWLDKRESDQKAECNEEDK
ncbi:TPA: hypothetical protein QHZ08_001973 [Enterobacter cloacae]|uniref:hypothetical protein n=1 Tax=Enterobacter TaxID=547 RepID=UPI0015B600A9|nr:MULTISPECIES: hypothetical protein [Enterobacter]HAS0831057.1 hypothetical protein [Enterobacter cloacae subsp. cloacae]NWJ80408.1 hypothetical protein [Enterobacter sp. SECR19-1250]QUG52258.1 hypothetical protein KDU74_00275 [Enterobacter cloacae]HDS4823237.1 hypothetical protein [Enterobacter cloacae]HDT2259961.1 hypothetical protein [Enterobacter cloacae]